MARVPFRQTVVAAASAGFDAVTCWPNVWRHAIRRDGLDLAGMRALLDDEGLVLTDCDYCSDWVAGSDEPGGTPGSSAGRHELMDVCAALGGSTVVAVHDGADGLVLERDAESFAALCDDAAEHGLRVALEFVPFTRVRDVTTAWRLVEAAGRPNGGLVFDTWHHIRSQVGDAAIAEVPPSRIFTIQVSDGPSRAPDADLAREARTGRLMPGSGAMDVGGVLRSLAAIGVRANLGPELWLPADARTPADLAVALLRATDAALATAGL